MVGGSDKKTKQKKETAKTKIPVEPPAHHDAPQPPTRVIQRRRPVVNARLQNFFPRLDCIHCLGPSSIAGYPSEWKRTPRDSNWAPVGACKGRCVGMTVVLLVRTRYRWQFFGLKALYSPCALLGVVASGRMEMAIGELGYGICG